MTVRFSLTGVLETAERKNMRRRKKRSIPRTIASVIILAIMAVCAYKIYDILHEYHVADKIYKDIKSDAITTEGPDFSKLPNNVNAWLVYKGVNIDYPVVQSGSRKGDNYWLHHTYNKKYNFAGTLFFPSWAKDTDQNRVIYGHAMNNGKMFGSLKKLKDQKFFNKHQEFVVYTRDGIKNTYQAYAVYETQDTSSAYEGNFEDFAAWKLKGWKHSCVETKKAGDGAVITLSTCNNRTFYGRVVVHGVLINSKRYK